MPKPIVPTVPVPAVNSPPQQVARPVVPPPVVQSGRPEYESFGAKFHINLGNFESIEASVSVLATDVDAAMDHIKRALSSEFMSMFADGVPLHDNAGDLARFMAGGGFNPELVKGGEE